jgi:Domain of unknown function (DUF4259)
VLDLGPGVGEGTHGGPQGEFISPRPAAGQLCSGRTLTFLRCQGVCWVAPESSFGEDARQWIIRARPSGDPDLVRLAHQAILRVIGPTSDLPELWHPESLPPWHSAMAELLDRLTAATGGSCQ